MANDSSLTIANLNLPEDKDSALPFAQGAIKGMSLNSNGALVISLEGGSVTTIENFTALAGHGVKLTLSDGAILDTKILLDTLAKDAAPVEIVQPHAGEVVTYELQPGQKYHIAFTMEHGDVKETDTALIITFDDGGQIIFTNFAAAMDADIQPDLIYNGGEYISLEDFLATLRLADAIEDHGQQPQSTVRAEDQTPPESQTNIKEARTDQNMDEAAKELAGVEPAAGGDNGGGASGHGFGFQSNVDPADLNAPPPIGPIGPTELNFGLPEFTDPVNVIDEGVPKLNPPSVEANLGVDDAIVKEDGSVFVPIEAALASGSPAGTTLTVTVTGISPAWHITNANGTYNAATGTWTITLPAGTTSYFGGLTFAPPHDSDIDAATLTATATATFGGQHQSVSDPFHIVTDAVADQPLIDADSTSGPEGTPVAIDVSASVTDTDGSESITHYRIFGVPEGFSFNHGSDLGGGTWEFTPAQMTGLTMSAPADFFGSVGLGVTAYNEETNLSGAEIDFSDNHNQASSEFSISWLPVADTPLVTANNGADTATVKEDGTVDVPLVASLNPVDSPDAYLTVTVTGFDPSWGTVTAPEGTFSPDGTTWTITLPPDTDLSTVFTFVPNAQGDIDLSALSVTATATEPATGTTASATDSFGITVDAVADDPSIAASGGTDVEGVSIAVNIAGALGADTDGSEHINHYEVSGVPDGFTFNHGTDLGVGVWSFTAGDLSDLTITADDSSFDGKLHLTATVFTTDNPTDGEYDSSDNSNSASTPFCVTWTPKIDPPTISVNGGADSIHVKEDGSVDVSVVAALSTGAEPAEYLTVMISGFDPAWGTVSAPTGTFNAAGTSWMVTLAPGAGLDTVFTFTPAAQSDIDLSGLTATAIATDPVEGISASSAPSSFNVVVDAVADVPAITATGGTEQEGHAIAVNIAGALGADTDGSEAITGYQVSGVPLSFFFNHGADLGGGVWVLTQGDLAGLTITANDPDFDGTVNLTATVLTTENPVSDGEFDTSDNNNSASTPLAVTWTPHIDAPHICFGGERDSAQVKEDGSVIVPVVASLAAGHGVHEYLTVTITGFDPSWGTVGAPVGTFSPDGTTWTITLAPGESLGTSFTFAPTAQSDIDLSGLVATATATDPSEGLSASSSDSFNVIVDAVADLPSITASDSSGNEGSAIAVNIAGSLGADTDGSEMITGYRVAGVPGGFTFNHGSNLGGGVWSLTQGDLAGLTISGPTNYNGTLNLTATVYNTENPVSDGEFDSSDNNNHNSDGFSVTWQPVADTPTVSANNGADNAQVKEDGSVVVPLTASLNPADSPAAYLTVTVTGFNPAWGAISAPVGSFSPDGSTWAITLPAGANLNTAFTFTPNAQSDIDLTGLTATATATEPSTGTTASASDSFNVIVDAVADAPSITATGSTGVEGATLVVTISGGLGADHDGSEIITGYKVAGVPGGFTFNHGSNLGGGVWSFTAAELAGLTITANNPDFDGSLNLTATVYNTENPASDGEYDGSDNNNSASTPFSVTWTPDIDPPTITVNGGIDNVHVKEDGSVNVFVGAMLAPGHGANEYLSVTITGFDPAWGAVSALNGSFNAAHTEWTITLAPGAALNTDFTFSPAAQSDIDLSGLTATATATDPSEGLSASSSDSFNVIVDAVADTPSITASAVSQEEGHPINVSIAGSLGADTDGSEVITGYRVSGVPVGFTFNHGTNLGGGVWSFTAAQLSGLQIASGNPDFEGTLNLTATVYNTENPVSDGEFDTSDNNNSASTGLTVTWTHDDEPVVSTPAPLTVDETSLVNGNIVVSDTLHVNFGTDTPGTFAATGLFTSGGSLEGGVLTSDGYAISVNLFANTYVGTANGHTVFTLALNSTTGAYTFTQMGNLDHANASDPNDVITLNFGLNATDSDGDHAGATVTVNVLDDAPHIDHVDNIVLPNIGGQYTGDVDVSGIQDSIDNFVLSALNGNVPDGLTYTVYAYGAALPGSLTGMGITGPAAGGSLLVATIDGSSDVFFTLKIGVDGQYTFDLITENPSVTQSADLTTVPPGNYASGIYYDADSGAWSQVATGAEVYIHGSSSINPSGQGIGVGNNQFEINESITFDFASDVSSASVTTIRSSGQDNWDLAVKWSAYDNGALVGTGTVAFTGPGGTFSFGDGLDISFDKLVLDGLSHSQNALTNDSAKFTISELAYNQTFLPDQLDLAFNVKVTDGDGDADNAPLYVSIVPPEFTVGTNIGDVSPSAVTYQVGDGHGTINGSIASDILVGDAGGSNLEAVDKDYNIVLILDVSGSMAGSKLTLLKQAVDNLLSDFHNYAGGDVKVEIVTFSDTTHATGTYMVTDISGYNSAISFVNGLTANGTTNYEAPLQTALSWLSGATANDPIAGATTFSYFVSDGEPNRYMNGTTPTDGTADKVMAQITGAGGNLGDNTNEVAQLQAYGEIVGVGIGVTSTTLGRLSVIDSGSDSALDVQNPADLSNALQGASPINQLAAGGSDTIHGGAGNDIIFGDSLNTDALAVLHGLTTAPGAGWSVFAQLELSPTWDRDDTISYITSHTGELGAETVTSTGATRIGGNDILDGGEGGDKIFGQEGNDQIRGGSGDDHLYGGSGADTFLFEATTSANGIDTIHDFSIAQGDKLDLSLLLSSYNPSQDAIDHFVFTANNGHGGTTLSVDVNGTGNIANAVQVATLDGVTGLDPDDLLASGNLVA